VKTSSKGLELIKEFEGCRLTAYNCASGVLTIGYGHTGPDVFNGQSISMDEAESLLVQDLHRFERAVREVVTVPLTQNQFDALVSFTFNVGAGALSSSTLLRLLNAGDYEGAAGQFSRWVNGANGPLPGLVRRRAAEQALFGSFEQSTPRPEEKPAAIATFTAKQDTFLKRKPVSSSELLAEELVNVEEGKALRLSSFSSAGDKHAEIVLAEGGKSWFIYRKHWTGWDTDGSEAVEVSAPPVEEVEEDKKPSNGVLLDVPYFPQRDNYRDASRTCFSSSCAMLLEYKKPGTLPGATGDDKYIKRVFEIGDTTKSDVQVKALESFGLKTSFIQNGSLDWLRGKLDEGNPVPIGILHKGTPSSPSGGGHWICVIGYDERGFIVNDPWGDLGHTSGTYLSTNGEHIHFSNAMMKSRWTVANDHDGWAISA